MLVCVSHASAFETAPKTLQNGCLFFFGMAKTDSLTEQRVNALRERPEDVKGLRYPQVVVDGTDERLAADTQRNASFLIF